ncbi:MAG: glycoside hydrolase family 5 protein [Ignavibacteria bacterium]|jgi:endoglucanase|nr:glycoside hydrolase family 5 protein [Ignavibacteria bacterium]MCU7498796.1 glycoside hydrolase family 5 protein [Ignavibacteria bacterium]MCU7512163.1 glycoside hydrolase family 5 protein [Ignavibacteria bacterium]MCU7520512.1 glycoside hydrolase family 5 protein [Ignavibacteria bacterium]MCU7523988.1 glycoside hydrolase family 5 protein [Ignavibacteria bacterium]
MIYNRRNFYFIIFSVILLITYSGCSGSSDGILEPKKEGITQPLDPFEQNKKLGRGINIGNSLEAPNEGEWGVTVKEEFFKLIKEKGFSSVRLPVKWSGHASDKAPYEISPDFFKRVDVIIDEALSRGLAVVLDMHHYDELIDAPTANKDRFISLWRQISEHYVDYSADLFFEVLNEPNGNLTPEVWNAYLKDAISAIREKNPYRTLIVGGPDWNSVGSIGSLAIPAEEKNVIATVHYYDPFIFTHQGAEWVLGSDLWLGTTWSATEVEKQAVAKDMDQLLIWSKANNRPVYIGEFGAYNKADIESRAQWTYYISRQAEQRGFSWSYWEFCSGFGVYDQAKQQWNQLLLSALIPTGV